MLKKLIRFIIPIKAEVLLCLIVFAAMLIFSVRSAARYEKFKAYYFDLGIMHQVVANTAQGNFLEITDPNYYQQGNRLGYHFDFILAFFAPVYMLFNDARVLLVGQSAIVALGAIPLYLLALIHLKHKHIGLLVALVYLLYYPVHATIIADFHSVTLSTSFLLWAWYGAEKKRYWLASIMIMLAWLTKENVPLVTATMGAYFYFNGHKKFGRNLFVLSGIWFFLVYKVIMPHFRGAAHFAESYYTTNVAENFARLFSYASKQHIVLMLYPLLFLPLFAPQILLLTSPEWLILLLSSSTNMRELQYHYTALLTPFIIVALIYALKRLRNIVNVSHVLVLLVVIQWLTLFNRSVLLNHYHVPPQEKTRAVFYWRQKLQNPNIPVATSGHLAPHFSGRRYFYNFLYDYAYFNQGITKEKLMELVNHYEKAEYVVIQESEMDPTDEMVQYYYFHLKANKKFEKIFDQDGIEVYRKISSTIQL